MIFKSGPGGGEGGGGTGAENVVSVGSGVGGTSIAANPPFVNRGFTLVLLLQLRRGPSSPLAEPGYPGCSSDIMWHKNMYPG